MFSVSYMESRHPRLEASLYYYNPFWRLVYRLRYRFTALLRFRVGRLLGTHVIGGLGIHRSYEGLRWFRWQMWVRDMVASMLQTKHNKVYVSALNTINDIYEEHTRSELVLAQY